MQTTRFWAQNEDAFGPQVLGCRAGFDFTVYFEEVVFTIFPASLLICCSLIRWDYLRSHDIVTNAGTLLTLKLVSHLTL
ncbi:hypothetical protein BDV32DRAFT_123527 [Aspergillus pseudonomiae]|nr:hypothetical protein BDV32DRAFT_123527 [Aspergillus pseudonomiae]